MSEFQPKPKTIIHNASVEGIFFCQSTSESTETTDETPSEKENSSYNIKDMRKQAERQGYNKGLLEGQEQGYEAGKSEGVALGMRQGQEQCWIELKSTINLFNQSAELFRSKQKEIFDETKPEIIRFCLSVCEHLLKRELSNPKEFKQVIEMLLKEGKSIIKTGVLAEVVIAPEDLQMIEHHIHAMTAKQDEFKELTFRADPTIEKGNCRLESSLGLINFNIKRLLDDLEKKVLEVK